MPGARCDTALPAGLSVPLWCGFFFPSGFRSDGRVFCVTTKGVGDLGANDGGSGASWTSSTCSISGATVDLFDQSASTCSIGRAAVDLFDQSGRDLFDRSGRGDVSANGGEAAIISSSWPCQAAWSSPTVLTAADAAVMVRRRLLQSIGRL